MMMVKAQAVIALAVAAALFGCQPPEEDEGPPKPRKVEFAGSVDKQYVGVWSTSDGRSVLDLGKSGELAIKSKVSGPQGDSDSEIKGQWLAQTGKLLMQYDMSGQTIAIEYQSTLSGNSLKLKEKSGRETEYSKK